MINELKDYTIKNGEDYAIFNPDNYVKSDVLEDYGVHENYDVTEMADHVKMLTLLYCSAVA